MQSGGAIDSLSYLCEKNHKSPHIIFSWFSAFSWSKPGKLYFAALGSRDRAYYLPKRVRNSISGAFQSKPGVFSPCAGEQAGARSFFNPHLLPPAWRFVRRSDFIE